MSRIRRGARSALSTGTHLQQMAPEAAFTVVLIALTKESFHRQEGHQDKHVRRERECILKVKSTSCFVITLGNDCIEVCRSQAYLATNSRDTQAAPSSQSASPRFLCAPLFYPASSEPLWGHPGSALLTTTPASQRFLHTQVTCPSTSPGRWPVYIPWGQRRDRLSFPGRGSDEAESLKKPWSRCSQGQPGGEQRGQAAKAASPSVSTSLCQRLSR